jgi:UDP-4-amino-4,6-dideoxy-N-acetyl-beta-L-altrosamine transaminase
MEDSPRFLPYGRQSVDEADIAAVAAVLRSDFLTTGPAVPRFEAALAKRLGARYVVACSNGTAALHLACLALGLGPGDAAIVPSITFLATANAVRMTGAEVVFADVEADTGLMGLPELTEAWARADAAGRRVKAVFPVHLAGQCADLSALADFSRRRGAVLVEDACHALGTQEIGADGRESPVGSCRSSAMTVLSFHPVKTIAAGEGGAISTQDGALAARLQLLRNHGMTRDPAELANQDLAFDQEGGVNPWYYEMATIGWNYRLSDIHAALAESQLGRLDGFVETRRTLAALYDELLAGHEALVRPVRRSAHGRAAPHLYPVLIDFDKLGTERSRVVTTLRSQGIGTQVHYIPVHRQPYYTARNPALALDGADIYYRRTLSLPLFVGMTGADVRRVVGQLLETLTGNSETQRPQTGAEVVEHDKVGLADA